MLHLPTPSQVPFKKCYEAQSAIKHSAQLSNEVNFVSTFSFRKEDRYCALKTEELREAKPLSNQLG
jgi:hypothetical protein